MAMKLTQLASKPQLIKLTLDDKIIVEEFGDELEFWIYDRQPVEEFIKLATASQEDYGQLINMVNQLVLDEDGKKIIQDGLSLPNKVMMAVIGSVVERLGK